MASRSCSNAIRRSSRRGAADIGRQIPPRRRLLKNAFGPALAQRQVQRVWALDEAWFGLKVWFRRRWCPLGARPPWVYAEQYEWLWLYAAVEPTTGHSFCVFLPRLDGSCFEVVLREWRRAFPQDRFAVVLDNSGAHTSRQVAWPAGIEPVPLPAYSPELNPGERLFKEL